MTDNYYPPTDYGTYKEEANKVLSRPDSPVKVYNKNTVNILFGIIAIFIVVFGWGIYNDKFKSEVVTTCPNVSIPSCPSFPTIPSCPAIPACPACPANSCSPTFSLNSSLIGIGVRCNSTTNLTY